MGIFIPKRRVMETGQAMWNVDLTIRVKLFTDRHANRVEA